MDYSFDGAEGGWQESWGLRLLIMTLNFLPYLQITCETTGWVGLGLSPNGGMAGADLAVAWVSADGEAFLEVRMHSPLYKHLSRLCSVF